MFDIPEEYKEAAQNSLRGGSESVPCPYPAPVMYWRHGDVALSSIGEIRTAIRFGGWGVDKETLKKVEQLPPELPNLWQLHENLTSKSNNSQYDAYLTRVAHVAPVKRRWRFLNFKKGDKTIKRSEVEYLCYLAERGEGGKGFAPWGWVLLTAKSYDTGALDAAFKEFETKSEKARGSTPVNFFYVAVGTFGETPKFESRHGKNGEQSQVTPPQLFTPQAGFTPETLQPVFVGQEVAADIYLALNDPAIAAWVDAWKKNDKRNAPANDVDQDYPQHGDFGPNPYE